MIPVLLGSTALIGYALLGYGQQKSSPEQFGVAQWGPPQPANVSPSLIAAVKELGDVAGKYPLLQKFLGPIFSQVELQRNEAGAPGYLRGFPITIPQLTGPRRSIAELPEVHQALELLKSLAVIVGLKNHIQPSFGVVKGQHGSQTMVVGFSTTQDVFWTGEMAMFPTPQEAQKIAMNIGGRRPGFDPRYAIRHAMDKVSKVSMPTSSGPRKRRGIRLPSLKRRM